MFITLPESRALRTRRLGGTVASVVIHSAVIAGAVGLTMTASAGARAGPPVRRDSIVYVAPVGHRPTAPAAPRGRTAPAIAAWPVPPLLPLITLTPGQAQTPPPADPVGPGVPFEPQPGIPTAGSVAGPEVSSTLGGVVGEYDTDRAPHVLGAAPQAHYPDALRAVGITGRVVVQFVVDTTGRAEPGSLEVLSATRAEFADAVRAVLSQFRFSAGEAGGRRVRTRVQLPFDFTLR